MRLERVEIEGIRGLGRVRLDLEPGTTVCVTGEAGAGKTTVLEAILAARRVFTRGAREPDGLAWRTPRSGPCAVDLTWELEPLEAILSTEGEESLTTTWRPGGESTALTPRLRDRVSATRVHYFDAHRLAPALAAEAAAFNDAVPPADASEAPSSRKYAWIERWLLARWDARAAHLASEVDERGIALPPHDKSVFARALDRLAPRVRVGRPVVRRGARLAGFVRADGAALALSELATSERMGVLFASVVEAAELCTGDALVLVDTPELAIHPAEQAAFLGAVGELVGRGTVIAATTSAAILRAAPRERVLVL